MSPLAVKSRYCQDEIDYATEALKPVFPIVYKDCFNDVVRERACACV